MKTAIFLVLVCLIGLFAAEEKRVQKTHSMTTDFTPDTESFESLAYVEVKEHSVTIAAKDGTWRLELARAGHPISNDLLEKMRDQKWPTYEQGLNEKLRKFIVNATRQ